MRINRSSLILGPTSDAVRGPNNNSPILRLSGELVLATRFLSIRTVRETTKALTTEDTEFHSGKTQRLAGDDILCGVPLCASALSVVKV